jgi:hypothetical protein
MDPARLLDAERGGLAKELIHSARAETAPGAARHSTLSAVQRALSDGSDGSRAGTRVSEARPPRSDGGEPSRRRAARRLVPIGAALLAALGCLGLAEVDWAEFYGVKALHGMLGHLAELTPRAAPAAISPALAPHVSRSPMDPNACSDDFPGPILSVVREPSHGSSESRPADDARHRLASKEPPRKARKPRPAPVAETPFQHGARVADGAPPEAGATSRAAAAGGAEVEPEPDWLGAQFSLVGRARKHLRSGKPEAALLLLEVYDKSFTRGVLGVEVTRLRQRAEDQQAAKNADRGGED